MSRRKRQPLSDRIAVAAERALAAHSCVSPLDVVMGIGWTDPDTVGRWRQGRIDSLEPVMNASSAKVREALRQLQDWARLRGLVASETEYVARTPQRQALRFSQDRDPEIERGWRTHWISGALSEAQRQRVSARASRPPELVVIVPLKSDWICQRCGGTGDLLIMEGHGPSCLGCAGLDELEFLPAGSSALTRRAKALSVRSAVVVRFSRTRGRYERQGVLLEPEALARAQRELQVGAGRPSERDLPSGQD